VLLSTRSRSSCSLDTYFREYENDPPRAVGLNVAVLIASVMQASSCVSSLPCAFAAVTFPAASSVTRTVTMPPIFVALPHDPSRVEIFCSPEL
jgi:hypothetical protein